MKFVTAITHALTISVLMAISGAAAQQDYPTKPIRLIVPYPPGGGTDPMARMAAQKLAQSWGQPVIVDNRPGGNTIIGTEAAAKAPPDGYTILLVTTPFVTGPSLLPHLPYDNVKDFAPIATIDKWELVLVLNPIVPANTLKEFIALAKAKEGLLNYATTGVGSGSHLAAEFFNIVAGVKMQPIAYKGSGQAISDIISGQVQLTFHNVISTISHIKSGRLKAIAITGGARLAALPQVPTFAEAGLPSYEMTGWIGLVAPARTPKAIIDKLSAEIARILAMPDTQDYLTKQGMEPFISTPDQLTALLKADMAKYARIIKTANIKLEN